jgi:hypothetical protein
MNVSIIPTTHSTAFATMEALALLMQIVCSARIVRTAMALCAATGRHCHRRRRHPYCHRRIHPHHHRRPRLLFHLPAGG